jgi:hypothetical protein
MSAGSAVGAGAAQQRAAPDERGMARWAALAGERERSMDRDRGAQCGFIYA